MVSANQAKQWKEASSELVRDEPMLSLMTASVHGDEDEDEDSRSGLACVCSVYGEEEAAALALLDGAGTATADDES